MVVSYSDYPTETGRLQRGYKFVDVNGAIYFFLPILLYFIITVNELLTEKERRLRIGVSIMGMTHSIYWLSAILTQMCLSASVVLIQLTLGVLLDYDIFVKTPIPVSFVFYFTSFMCIQFVAIFISTVVADPRQGYTIAYGFVLFSLVLESFFATNIFIQFLYANTKSVSIWIFKLILNLYPAFHYSKIYIDISQQAATSLNVQDSFWQKGPGFTYQSLFTRFAGRVPIGGGKFRKSGSGTPNYSSLNFSSLSIEYQLLNHNKFCFINEG